MQFRLRQTAGSYDIPIASILTKDVFSNDVVHLADYSGYLTENGLPGIQDIQSYPDASNETAAYRYRLVARNIFEDVQLTDEYHYDVSTGTITPLWYYHGLTCIYFNSRTVSKTVRRSVRPGYEAVDSVITSLIPADGNYVIPMGSLSVLRNGVALNADNFYVDYAKGAVTISSSYVTSGDSFLVSYRLTPLDIQVSSDTYTLTRVEISAIGNSNYFVAAILSTEPNSMTVSYNSTASGGQVRQVEEQTTSVPIFTKVSESNRQVLLDRDLSSVGKRVFSLYDPVRSGAKTYIYTMVSNGNHKFSFRSATGATTRIALSKPANRDFYSDWFPVLSVGSFERDGKTFTSSKIGASAVRVTEQATFVDKRTVSVSNGNLITSMDSSGNIANISVKRGDETMGIEYVDRLSGIITLTDDVARNDVVTVTYVTRRDGSTIDNVCLNPLQQHNHHNHDITENVVVYLMVDDEVSEESNILVKILPLSVEGKPFTYSYAYIDERLNATDPATRNAFRSDIVNLPAALLSDSSDPEEYGIIMILGTMYVANPLDEDGYQVEDARLYGGGVSSSRRSFHDWSFFDGEAVDLHSLINVTVPRSVYDDLLSRAVLWDPGAVQSDEPEAVAHAAVMALLRNKVAKYSRVGTIQEIEVADG